MIITMQSTRVYQAKFAAPFGVLGICCDENILFGIDFLVPESSLQAPENSFAKTVCKQLAAYFAAPDFQFTLPFKVGGTPHQNKVWQAMRCIPRGQTRQYGELALSLNSSPRAVGQACGANPIPIVIPCHRVVSKTGMGGFAHQQNGYLLDIKCWLLLHEQR